MSVQDDKITDFLQMRDIEGSGAQLSGDRFTMFRRCDNDRWQSPDEPFSEEVGNESSERVAVAVEAEAVKMAACLGVGGLVKSPLSCVRAMPYGL